MYQLREQIEGASETNPPAPPTTRGVRPGVEPLYPE